jgi:hypothetical protein
VFVTERLETPLIRVLHGCQSIRDLYPMVRAEHGLRTNAAASIRRDRSTVADGSI